MIEYRRKFGKWISEFLCKRGWHGVQKFTQGPHCKYTTPDDRTITSFGSVVQGEFCTRCRWVNITQAKDGVAVQWADGAQMATGAGILNERA